MLALSAAIHLTNLEKRAPCCTHAQCVHVLTLSWKSSEITTSYPVFECAAVHRLKFAAQGPQDRLLVSVDRASAKVWGAAVLPRRAFL